MLRQDVPIKRILLQQAAVAKSPVSGTFELTPRCNLHCAMCYIRMSPEELRQRGAEHDADDWIELGRQARDAGTLFLLLTGGEPFLRPDFPEIYRALSQMGFVLSINTNGTLLGDRLLALLTELPPSAINLTLYGADAEDYQRLCGDGSAFARARAAVDRLCEAKLPLVLNYTLTSRNRHALEPLAAFAKDRGLSLRTVTYLYPPVRRDGTGMERLDPETAGILSAKSRLLSDNPAHLARSIAALRAKQPEPTPPEDCLSGSVPGLRCSAGNCQYWVSWNGEMYPCGMMPSPVVYPFRDGLKAAWETLVEACRAIPTAAQCRSCGLQSYCPACPAAALAETGATDGVPNYICRLTAAYCRTLGSCELPAIAE